MNRIAPNVCIITLHHRNEAGLVRCLESIEKQRVCPNLWLIQSSNVISDVTRKRLQKPWIEIQEEADTGFYDALNKALERCPENAWIGLLHCDDVYQNNRVLDKVVQTIQSSDQVQWIYGGVAIQNKHGKVGRTWVPSEFKPWKLLWGYMPPHPALFFHASIIQDLGPFNPQLQIAGDYDWMLRLMLGNFTSKRIPEVLIIMAPPGISSNFNRQTFQQKMREDVRVIQHRMGVSQLRAGLIWIFKISQKIPQFFK